MGYIPSMYLILNLYIVVLYTKFNKQGDHKPYIETNSNDTKKQSIIIDEFFNFLHISPYVV